MTPPLCSVDVCERKRFGRQPWCDGHYQQHRAGKIPAGPLRRRRSPGATLIRDAVGNKQCVICELWLPEDKFYAGGSQDQLQTYCRPCSAVGHRVRAYKLRAQDIAAALIAQDYTCAICSADISERYTVDHDHACCPGSRSCGSCVRGLLCNACNTGLGRFKDSVDIMRAAIDYLEYSPRIEREAA